MGEPSSVAAPQDRAVLNGKGEELLNLLSKRATSAQWAEWLRAPLEHAVAEGDKTLARCLLEAGANGGAGWKGCDDRTLLQAAAEGGNQKLVSALLEEGALAELDTVSGECGMSALQRASERGHTAAARVLMAAGAEANLLDSRQRSALHYAVEGGSLKLVDYLMIAGVDVDVKDVDGNTPLHLAAANGHKKIVSTLLRRGGDTEVANCEGKHALHVAVGRGDVVIVEELLKAGANPNARYGRSNRYSPLYFGAKDAEVTKTLVKHGADVTSTDTLGFTTLYWAALHGVSAVIDVLLQNGADLEARSSSVKLTGKSRVVFSCKGLTPLHFATYGRNLEGMTSLLHHGSSINVTDDDGLTPLHLVCKSFFDAGSVIAADFLLRRGADDTIADKNGRLPVDLVENSSGVDPARESLKRLMLNASADRTWRRRGMLIMCRSRVDKVNEGREERADKIIRHNARSETDGVGSAARDAGVCGTSLVGRMVRIDADVIFRTIIGFL